MGFKLGGFVCDKCSIFQKYDGARCSDFFNLETEYPIPDGWKVMSNHIVSEDNWVSTNNEEHLIICCSNCSRSLKINKIKNGIHEEKKEDSKIKMSKV